MARISSLLLLATGLLSHGVDAKMNRTAWNITVYVQATTLSLRKISATDASFVFEGIIKYAWRDDSVWDVTEDGDSYPGANNIIWGYGSTPLTRYAYSTGQVTGSPTWYGPIVNPRFSNRVATSFETLTYTVNYGPLDWTGVPADNATLFPYETWVEGQHTFGGTFLQQQSLKDFPFDTQVASFTLVMGQETSDMKLILAPRAREALTPPTNPDGWTVLGTNIVLDVDNSRGMSSSRIQFQTRVQRIPDFFVNRFVIPLCLIMIIAYGSVFLAAAFVARLASPMVAFGSSVSFLFVAAQSVPQLPYATRLDKFFLLMFFSCFMLFAYHVLIYIVFERFAKATNEARKRAGGPLYYLWTPAPPAASVTDAPSPAGTVTVPVSEAAAADSKLASVAPQSPPPKPKPAHVLGILFESGPQEIADTIFFWVFCCSFLVAASVILRGSSMVVGAT